ncbi:MAG: hypothetical protein ABMA25_19370 [Ilumatobacteraceae bacterium]
MTDTAPQATIQVTAKFFPLFWILFLIKPHVVIDGSDVQGAWNTPQQFPVAAGGHTVTVYFPYFIPRKAGKGTVTVDVAPGQTVNVGYKAPWIVFFKGRMTVS